MLNSIVLHNTILYLPMLYFIVQYYIVLHYAIHFIPILYRYEDIPVRLEGERKVDPVQSFQEVTGTKWTRKRIRSADEYFRVIRGNEE